MEKQTENRLMDMGRGEERVRCMERVTWKLTLPYVKYICIEQTYRCRIRTENRLTVMGRGEERVRCMDRVTWKLTLPYVR